MTGVRWHDGDLEGKCSACRDWWPLTREFWMPNSGVARCRACIAEARPYTTPKARRPMTAEQREYHREYNREWMRRYRREQRRFVQTAEMQDAA